METHPPQGRAPAPGPAGKAVLSSGSQRANVCPSVHAEQPLLNPFLHDPCWWRPTSPQEVDRLGVQDGDRGLKLPQWKVGSEGGGVPPPFQTMGQFVPMDQRLAQASVLLICWEQDTFPVWLQVSGATFHSCNPGGRSLSQHREDTLGN